MKFTAYRNTALFKVSGNGKVKRNLRNCSGMCYPKVLGRKNKS